MTNDKISNAAEAFKTMQPHTTLDAWLRGDGIDKAHKAMNISAMAKKPGRVGKRVGKALSSIFSAPRVIAWEPGRKNVFAAAHSRGLVEDVVILGDFEIPRGDAVFQTDLYFRANKDVTEVNASTVSGIRAQALDELALLRTGPQEDIEAMMHVALTLARIFQTGIKDSDLDERKPHQFLLPNKGDAMVVVSLPIKRIEFEKELVGQVVLVTRIIPEADVDPQDRASLDEMKTFLTKDGHPGAEKFAEIVAARALPVDETLF